MKKYCFRIISGNTVLVLLAGMLSALLSACSNQGADKDISPMIAAWKTADQTQNSVCRPYLKELEEKWDADTTEDQEQSYMEFLGTVNALRDYAKNNPSTRVEIRNTIYEVYGKMLYGSDKQDYLEAETIKAIKKAVPLNDQTLLAELYKLMAELTADEPLRSAIYDTKSIDILSKRDRAEDFYLPEDYALLAYTFYEAEDWKDAIKYGNMFLDISTGDTSENVILDRLAVSELVGTSYMETNQWDSCSAMFENILNFNADSTLSFSEETMSDLADLKDIAEGKYGLVQAKWQQFAPARQKTEKYLKNSLGSKDTSGIIYAYLSSSMINSGEGDVKKAVSDLKQARRYATTKRFPRLQTKIYDQLVKAFEDLGQEDSASVCKRKLQLLEEKISTSKQNIELLKTKTEHELLQIQNDIDTAHHEKVSKRSWTWLVLLIVILIAIIAFMMAGRRAFRIRIHKRIVRQHERTVLEKEKKNIEMMTASLRQSGMLEEDGSPKKLSDEDTWNAFRQKFTTLHPCFFDRLNKALGRKATPTYEKVSVLIHLGLDNADIAKVLDINKDSVGRTRRRIRELAGCQTQEELRDLISGF